MKTKARIIRGFVKYPGKFMVKGIVKGGELIGRAGLKTVNALVKNPGLQKIATTAGLYAASVMIPGVGAGLIATMGLKYMIDKAFFDERNEKTLLSEIADIISMTNVVTKTVCNHVASPIFKGADNALGKAGKDWQKSINDNADNLADDLGKFFDR